MAGFNIFKNDAFSGITLTAAIQRMESKPGFLTGLNMFRDMPTTTADFAIDMRETGLSLIPTTVRGDAPVQQKRDSRSMIRFTTPRIAKGFTMYANEIEGVRAFGSMSELETMQVEYARRMQRVNEDFDLTKEYHILGAIDGLVLDADGTSVIEDFFDRFGITRPDVFDFELDNPSTDVKKKCAELRRMMIRRSRGKIGVNTQIYGLNGDDFWDRLISHPSVEKFYLQHAAAAELRGTGVFEVFRFGGISFVNYQGTDDNTTVAIGAGEARFFPVGASDVFQRGISPAEFFPFVNTMGQEVYAMNLEDPSGRQGFVIGEQYRYHLHCCTVPEVLVRGVSH